MRTCDKCGVDMKEGCYLYGRNTESMHNMFLIRTSACYCDNGRYSDLRAAVCPRCGHVEFYVENPEKFSR